MDMKWNLVLNKILGLRIAWEETYHRFRLTRPFLVLFLEKVVCLVKINPGKSLLERQVELEEEWMKNPFDRSVGI